MRFPPVGARRFPGSGALAVAALGLAVTAATVPGSAWATGRCDLNDVVGFQVLFGKPIEAFVQNGVRKNGYVGCEPDRVLVFADNTGVRCKGVAVQHPGPLPVAYLFANAKGEMKLCVEGELFDVTTTN